MTSLLAVLLLAGHAAAQPAPIGTDWRPTGQPKPQPLPTTLQKVEPVQFKAPPPTKITQPPPEEITRVAAQMKSRTGEDDYEFTVRIEPPGIDVITKRNSEEQFFQELRDEARKRPGLARIFFPEEEPATTRPFLARQFPYRVRIVEPNYVCHGLLLYEQKNFDRYGWDLGPVTPAVNTLMFYYDTLMLPYHVGANICRCYDCSAGKCLPGDPVPLLLYHEQFSVTGLIFEATALGGGAFVFP